MNIAAIIPQLQRAQMLHQQGRVGEAWSALAPLRSAIDNHGQALRLYAVVALSAGRNDDALEALKRVGVLEHEPADILGGLADLLGQLGRHDEALPLWDRLVARHPELADAHLNRVVTATNAGRNELAIKAADEGLSRFPADARLLATRALALKNLGRIMESIEAFETAVAADPNRALTRHNQAIALRTALRFDEACEAFEVAARLGMNGPDFDANWAATALEAGRIDEAVQLYERALRTNPSHAQALKNLTRVKIEYLQSENAFDHYEHSMNARGGNVESWIDWISALSSNYRHGDAVRVGRLGLKQHPGEPTLEALTLFAEGMSDDAASALERINKLPERVLRPPATIIGRAQIALRAGQPELAAQLAEEFTRHEPTNQIGWAILAVAWRLTGDPREEWLCDYERLVMVTDVPAHDGSLPPAEYAAFMAEVLEQLHKSRAAPGNQSLREGTQTAGALFDSPDPAIQDFRKAIRAAAEKLTTALPNDPTHPFLSRKGNRLEFSGSWSVRLRAGGGHHVPHFHSLGWMSSAYYARLPHAGETERERHEGWIQFGQPPATYDLDLPPRRIIEPKAGRLVLFPSYMWHGTIPFTSGDRLTAAFDFVPA